MQHDAADVDQSQPHAEDTLGVGLLIPPLAGPQGKERDAALFDLAVTTWPQFLVAY